MGEFGLKLRSCRENAGLSQRELGDCVGVSGVYISLLENSRKQPPPEAVVESIAEAVGVPKKELWALARAERTANLSERVSGTPTSKRFSAKMKLDPPEERKTQEQSILEELEASLSDPARRKKILSLLSEFLQK